MRVFKINRVKSYFVFSTVLTLFISRPVFAEPQADQVYSINYIAAAPKIDGKLDDVAWASLPEATGFWQDGVAEKKQTYFRMGWDKDNLYIGIKCDEPDVLEVRGIGKDGGRLWEEDSVEIFLAPFEGYYFQLVVNTLGSHIGMVGKGAENVIEKWESKSYIGKDFWSMEACIPFATLGIEKAVKDGDKWRGNIARNITVFTSGGKPNTSWARLGLIGFHDPDNFGTFVFKQGKP